MRWREAADDRDRWRDLYLAAWTFIADTKKKKKLHTLYTRIHTLLYTHMYTYLYLYVYLFYFWYRFNSMGNELDIMCTRTTLSSVLLELCLKLSLKYTLKHPHNVTLIFPCTLTRLTHSAMKSLNNCDQLDGLDSPGGGFLTIWNSALVGWMSRYGGLPLPNSMAVIPKNRHENPRTM